MKIKECRSCNNPNLDLILDLGEHAWCNNFLTKDQIGTEKIYPLQLVFCPACSLAQINYTIPKETMFAHHTYTSGTTKTLKQHFKYIAEKVIKTYNVTPNDLIIDIGGNDGTNLLQYKKLGCNNLLNVESARNIAQLARDADITTDIVFFDDQYAQEKLNAGMKKAKIINASGVFFHLEELHSVIQGIHKLLASDGVFVVQFMYFLDMLNKGTFDGIYHEHLCYYTLTSLCNLLSPYGLYLINAHHADIHSGSMIAYFSKTPKPLKKQVQMRLELEKQLINYDTFAYFKFQAQQTKIKLINTVLDDKDHDKKIVGLGSPAKGNTLLTYCDLNHEIVDELLEINPLKIGLYSPITHIPIVKQDSQPPDTTFILLSHNFSNEIMGEWLPYKCNVINPFKLGKENG